MSEFSLYSHQFEALIRIGSCCLDLWLFEILLMSVNVKIWWSIADKRNISFFGYCVKVALHLIIILIFLLAFKSYLIALIVFKWVLTAQDTASLLVPNAEVDLDEESYHREKQEEGTAHMVAMFIALSLVVYLIESEAQSHQSKVLEAAL